MNHSAVCVHYAHIHRGDDDEYDDD
jgi:hypothetical protein